MAAAKKAVKKTTPPANEAYVWYYAEDERYVGNMEYDSIAACEKDMLDGCEDESDVIIAKIVKRYRIEMKPSLKEIK